MSQEYKEVLTGGAHMQIGKNGVTPNIVEHVSQLLKHNKILKIKFLREIADQVGIETLVKKLAQELGLFVLDVRGFTVIVSKRKIEGIRGPKKYSAYGHIKKKKTVAANLGEEDAPEKQADSSDVIAVESEDIVEPEYIDYDDDNLLKEIDKQSDEIYGAVKGRTPEKPRDDAPRDKAPRGSRITDKSPKSFRQGGRTTFKRAPGGRGRRPTTKKKSTRTRK